MEGRWRGPGRGHIDPTKEVAAAAARIEAGISTLEDECAEYDGSDWREKLEQKAREVHLMEDLGLRQVDTGLRVAILPEADEAEADRQRDERPSSALAQVRATADSAGHTAFLDARPGAA